MDEPNFPRVISVSLPPGPTVPTVWGVPGERSSGADHSSPVSAAGAQHSRLCGHHIRHLLMAPATVFELLEYETITFWICDTPSLNEVTRDSDAQFLTICIMSDAIQSLNTGLYYVVDSCLDQGYTGWYVYHYAHILCSLEPAASELHSTFLHTASEQVVMENCCTYCLWTWVVPMNIKMNRWTCLKCTYYIPPVQGTVHHLAAPFFICHEVERRNLKTRTHPERLLPSDLASVVDRLPSDAGLVLLSTCTACLHSDQVFLIWIFLYQRWILPLHLVFRSGVPKPFVTAVKILPRTFSWSESSWPFWSFWLLLDLEWWGTAIFF